MINMTHNADQTESVNLSVITVTKNDPEGFLKTLGSLDIQFNQSFEWVVVDGGGSDLERALNGHSRLNPKFVRDDGIGLYRAMNQGLDVATMSHVVFLNGGDEFYCENTIQTILAGLSENKILVGQTLVVGKWSSWVLPADVPAHNAIIFPVSELRYNDKTLVYGDSMYIRQNFSRYEAQNLTELITVFKLGGVSNNFSWNLVKCAYREVGILEALKCFLKLVSSCAIGIDNTQSLVYELKGRSRNSQILANTRVQCPNCGCPDEKLPCSSSQLFECGNCFIVFRYRSLIVSESQIRSRYFKTRSLKRYATKFVNEFSLASREITELGPGQGCVGKELRKMCRSYQGFDKYFSGEGPEKSQYLDLEAPLFSGQKLDVVVCFDVVEHVKNIDSLFASISKNLDSNGLIFFETGIGEHVRDNQMGWYLEDETHCTFLTENYIRRIANEAGLEVIELRKSRHKSTSISASKNAIQFLAWGISRLIPKALRHPRLQQLWNPYQQNHYFCLLKKA